MDSLVPAHRATVEVAKEMGALGLVVAEKGRRVKGMAQALQGKA